MFRIAELPRFTVPVPLTIEVDGEAEDQSFSATFQMLEIDASRDLDDEQPQREFLRRAIVGLREIVDDDGAEVPFTPELREAVINRFDSRRALLAAYFARVQEIARGN